MIETNSRTKFISPSKYFQTLCTTHDQGLRKKKTFYRYFAEDILDV